MHVTSLNIFHVGLPNMYISPSLSGFHMYTVQGSKIYLRTDNPFLGGPLPQMVLGTSRDIVGVV